jgi:hypothetical protein
MSGTKRPITRILKYAVASLIAGASSAALYAQGCAMCYQSAAASGPRAIQALRSGVLILMLPPVLITFGITIMAYRRRNLYNDDSST